LSAKETTVGKKTMTQSIVTREVEKKLNWWQKLFVWTGGVVLIVGLSALMVWINNKTNFISILLEFMKKI
jgi:hypothetical protein